MSDENIPGIEGNQELIEDFVKEITKNTLIKTATPEELEEFSQTHPLQQKGENK